MTDIIYALVGCIIGIDSTIFDRVLLIMALFIVLIFASDNNRARTVRFYLRTE